MTLTRGGFTSLHYAQKIMPFPWHVDKNAQRLSINPLYWQSHLVVFRPIFYFLAIIFMPPTFGRVGWLWFHWDTYTIYQLEEVVIYCGFICFFLAFVPALYMIQWQYTEVIYFINQSVQAGSSVKSVWTRNIFITIPKLGKRSIFELLVYGFSIFVGFVPAAIFAGPFVLNFCPLQLCFGTSIFVKCCAATLYGFAALVVAHTLLTVLILIIMVEENVIYFTSTLYIKKTSEQFLLKNFSLFIRFRATQMILKIAQSTYGVFLTNLIFIGILLASLCGYVVINMYSILSIVSYVFTFGIFVICFIVALLLTFLVNISLEDSKRFVGFWGLHLKKREHQKILLACKPIGFELGPYGIARAELGLLICDDIMVNVVTLSLLGAS